MSKVVFYFLIYIFIFNPPITALSIASIRLLYPVLLIWMIKKNYWFRKFLSLFKKELLILSAVVFFTIFRTIIGGDATFIKDTISIIIDCFFLSFFFVLICERLRPKKNIYQIFYELSIIASLISVILFLNPYLNEVVRNNFFLGDVTAAHFAFRCFGIAAGLSFDYSIIIGLALCYCLIKNKIMCEYLLIPIFLFTCLINARTGIIMPLLLFVFVLFFRFKLSYCLLIALIVSGVSFLTTTEFFIKNMESFMWIGEGLLEISDLFLGTSNASGSTIDTLSSSHTFFPANLSDWILGSGENVYFGKSRRSDIGYIIQLNYGGIIYMLTIWGSLLYPIIHSYGKISKRDFSFLCFILLTLIICNYKGSLYNTNGVLRIYFFLYVYSLYSYKRKHFRLNNEKNIICQ